MYVCVCVYVNKKRDPEGAEIPMSEDEAAQVFMHVCMHVCMYVYVCMYVCMSVCL